MPPTKRTDADGPTGSRAPAVARVAAVLRLLSGETEGLGVNEIARRLGLVPSTCLHILRALVDEGFLAFDPHKKTYRIGVGLLTVVRAGLANADFPQAVQPELDRLAAKYGVTAVAVELESRERMMVVAISKTSGFISLRVNVGSRFPALISATGRLLAASLNLSRGELEARFRKLTWAAPPDFETWLDEIEQARRDGLGIDRGNYIQGVTVVSVLLPKTEGAALRGITLIGLSHTFTDAILPDVGKDLQIAVQACVAQLA